MADHITFTSEGTPKEGPNDAEMAKTFDGEETASDEQSQGDGQEQQGDQQQQSDDTGDRPEWLPENFKSPEDLAKSYQEQQSALTKAQQELAELKKNGKADDAEDGEDGEDADGDDKSDKDDKPKASEITEEDLQDYTKELAETGEISEESREKILEMFDVPEFLVDTYIEGAKAMNERQTSTIQNAFGGEEQQTEVLEWAGKNLSDKEMETVNKQFESGDMNTVLFAIDALKGKYEAANGKPPSKRLGGEGQATSGDTYGSWDEVSRDMDNEKYHSDPAFRAQVEKKLANSKNL